MSTKSVTIPPRVAKSTYVVVRTLPPSEAKHVPHLVLTFVGPREGSRTQVRISTEAARRLIHELCDGIADLQGPLAGAMERASIGREAMEALK